MSAPETVRFSVSLPARLFAAMQRSMERRGLSSRSKYVRDLIREQGVEERWSRGTQEVVGVITMGYDHHEAGLLDRINAVQHDHHAAVLCATHVHLDHDHCLEAIILRGRPAEIERIHGALGALRGVRFCRLTRASKIPE